MSAEPVRRRKNRKTNTSLGIPHTFSFPLLPTHECRAVNLHMMTLKILFHMDVKWGSRRSGRPDSATNFTAMRVNQDLARGTIIALLGFLCDAPGQALWLSVFLWRCCYWQVPSL